MLQKAVNFLKRGGIVIYPTETSYGLGCDATNQSAVDLIFKIKKRAKSKTLPLIAGSLAMVKKYCQMSKQEEKLAKKYWPGPLTLVLHRRGDPMWSPARGVVAKDGTVAIRLSSHPIARELSRRLGRPIVSTSANLSGQGECYSVEEVEKQLKNVGATLCGRPQNVEATPVGRPPIIIINGGRLKKRKPSTIVKMEKDGRIRVLRQGSVGATLCGRPSWPKIMIE